MISVLSHLLLLTVVFELSYAYLLPHKGFYLKVEPKTCSLASSPTISAFSDQKGSIGGKGGFILCRT